MRTDQADDAPVPPRFAGAAGVLVLQMYQYRLAGMRLEKAHEAVEHL